MSCMNYISWDLPVQPHSGPLLRGRSGRPSCLYLSSLSTVAAAHLPSHPTLLLLVWCDRHVWPLSPNQLNSGVESFTSSCVWISKGEVLCSGVTSSSYNLPLRSKLFISRLFSRLISQRDHLVFLCPLWDNTLKRYLPFFSHFSLHLFWNSLKPTLWFQHNLQEWKKFSIFSSSH